MSGLELLVQLSPVFFGPRLRLRRAGVQRLWRLGLLVKLLLPLLRGLSGVLGILLICLGTCRCPRGVEGRRSCRLDLALGGADLCLEGLSPLRLRCRGFLASCGCEALSLWRW